MGADMVLAFVDFPKSPNLREELEKVLAFVDGVTNDDIDNIYDDLLSDSLENEGDYYPNARQNMKEFVVEGFKALTHRHTTTVSFMDRLLFVTGGITWGGPPTTPFEPINKLAVIMGMM